MRLVIAEKPELGRNIAHAVCRAPKGARLPYEGEPYTVVACAGHLLELAEPEEVDPDRWGRPWREETLPVLPRPWPKVVSKGKRGLVDSIAALVARADEVVNAGDPDDEGQLIVDELLDYLGYEGPVRRVLVNDNIDRNIRRAFDEMGDNAPHVGAGRAANARAIADFCFGASESRLACLRNPGAGTLSVGRVQTPALGLVVRRDLEIEGHVAKAYSRLVATCAVDGTGALEFACEVPKSSLDEDGRLSDRGLAARYAEAIGTAGSLEASCEVTRRSAPAPLPYNLAELTADMSRRHKMTAKRVMDATQSLRETHRAITYNRSDCQWLPRAAFDEAPETLRVAMGNVGASWDLSFDGVPRCFDDSKIDAHTGIIPQAQAVDASRLSKDERAVYQAIVERYAMQFAGDEEFDISETRTVARLAGGLGDVALSHKAKRQVSAGWRAVADDGKAQRGFAEGWVEAGSHGLSVSSCEAREERTKPKAPYTEGTLFKDMANAAKYVSDPELRAALKRKDEGKPGEHGSIGTSATRAQVIETLKARGFIEERKGRLVSTRLGRDFYRACPDDIKGVDTTARWWLIQERVAQGSADEYAVAEDVCRVFEGHRRDAWTKGQVSGAGASEVGRCPVCGRPVVDRGPKSKQYTCSSNRWERTEDGSYRRTSGCGFSMWKTVAGKALTPAQAKALLEKGRTGVIHGFKSKSGKPFDARLRLDPKTGEVGFEFEDRPRERAAGRAGKRRRA